MYLHILAHTLIRINDWAESWNLVKWQWVLNFCFRIVILTTSFVFCFMEYTQHKKKLWLRVCVQFFFCRYGGTFDNHSSNSLPTQTVCSAIYFFLLHFDILTSSWFSFNFFFFLSFFLFHFRIKSLRSKINRQNVHLGLVHWRIRLSR